jgi:hypothetical protein
MRTGGGGAQDLIIELISHLILPLLSNENVPLLFQGPNVVTPTSRVSVGVKEARGSVSFLQPKNAGFLSSNGALEGGQAETLLLCQLSQHFFVLSKLSPIPCQL